MSSYRQQAQLDVPASAVWELVGNVERHPEWWPRVINVQCDGLEEGCSYRQVYTRWLITEAQGGTFIDAEFGLDPKRAATRVFDVVAGRRYFRHWLEQSIEGLRRAAREGVTA
jgi:hypothetical protein